MKRLIIGLIISVCFLTPAGAAPVQVTPADQAVNKTPPVQGKELSADFTLHVKLNLVNIPQELADNMMLLAVVYADNSGPRAAEYVPIPFQNGNYQGTLTAKLNGGIYAPLMKNYFVALVLHKPGPVIPGQVESEIPKFWDDSKPAVLSLQGKLDGQVILEPQIDLNKL